MKKKRLLWCGIKLDLLFYMKAGTYQIEIQ